MLKYTKGACIMQTRYYDNISDKLKDYFAVLSPEFPEWLHEYIDTPEMQRIGNISMDCGCDYTDLFPKHPWHSNLDHSVGVALIIWHFTKDKKQTLAGLFHDIATPVFKHCIDFMNGDYEHQESTEERTKLIIQNSNAIMSLLARDQITLEEVSDYKIYPIADNDSPKLAADRFEYNFCCGYIIHPIWTLDDLRECYNDVTILKNEDGIPELGFKNLKIAEKYIHILRNLWPWWINDEERTSMQFFADMCASMNNLGYLSIDDLYTLPENEVVKKFKTCGNPYLEESFKKFENATKCYRTNAPVSGKYCVNIKGKRRYVNPLVQENNLFGRVYDLSKQAQKDIDDYMKIPIDGYTYLDFEFTPIKPKKEKTFIKR